MTETSPTTTRRSLFAVAATLAGAVSLPFTAVAAAVRRSSARRLSKNATTRDNRTRTAVAAGIVAVGLTGGRPMLRYLAARLAEARQTKSGPPCPCPQSWRKIQKRLRLTQALLFEVAQLETADMPAWRIWAQRLDRDDVVKANASARRATDQALITAQPQAQVQP